MSANPNWARWIHASVAYALKAVATEHNLAVLVEGIDERSEAFMQATDKVEIRITGPFTKETSKGCFRIWVDINVLIQSRYDGQGKNAYDALTIAGIFHEAMTTPFAIWNYGNKLGDFVDADPSTHVFLDCLVPRNDSKQEAVRVINLGQISPTDKMKQAMVDGRYEMYINEG